MSYGDGCQSPANGFVNVSLVQIMTLTKVAAGKQNSNNTKTQKTYLMPNLAYPLDYGMNMKARQNTI